MNWFLIRLSVIPEDLPVLRVLCCVVCAINWIIKFHSNKCNKCQLLIYAPHTLAHIFVPCVVVTSECWASKGKWGVCGSPKPWFPFAQFCHVRFQIFQSFATHPPPSTVCSFSPRTNIIIVKACQMENEILCRGFDKYYLFPGLLSVYKYIIEPSRRKERKEIILLLKGKGGVSSLNVTQGNRIYSVSQYKREVTMAVNKIASPCLLTIDPYRQYHTESTACGSIVVYFRRLMISS